MDIFKTYEEGFLEKEKMYGLFMEDIPKDKLNFKDGDVADGDIYYRKKDGRGDLSIFSPHEYRYLIARQWRDKELMVFKLYTNEARHYLTKKELQNKWINARTGV